MVDLRLKQALSDNTDNYIAPFLWLHNEDDKDIVNELEKIYKCGIRCVCLESRVHDDFCGDDWWSDVRVILEFCRQHDMKAWILDDKRFPSGYANGYYETHPELLQWNITEQHLDVAGPVTDGMTLAGLWRSLPNDEILGIFACKHIPNSSVLCSEILDLTNGLIGDTVHFSLPDGMWRIVYLLKTRSGLNGTCSDKLSRESTGAYINAVHEKHWENLSEYFGNTLLGFFSDESCFGNGSIEPGASPRLGDIQTYLPWHETVRQHFVRLYGDNAMRNLLALWFDFDDIPFRQYRIDYMKFITEAYAENYTGMIAQWCHEHGVEYIGHIVEDNNSHYRTGWSVGHYFNALRPQDMSGVDVVLHQIMPGLTECANSGLVFYKEMDNKFFNYCLAKLGASLAHITPHMKHRAMCEIFGAYGWAEGTRTMKYLMDHMLVRGINYFVPHAFSPKPDDEDFPPNFYASGKNPQFKYFKELMGYMNRMCHLLSKNIHVNTCAILYDAENVWSGAATVPLEEIAKRLYDNRLDYDIIPIEALNDMDENGFINGEKYGLIIVPGCDYIQGNVLERLKTISTKVIYVSNSHKDEFETVALDELCSYLYREGLSDVICDTDNINLRYYHCVCDKTHIYMFSNEDINNVIETTVSMNAYKGGEYIEYDVWGNNASVRTGNTEQIKLKLEPYNSILFVFGADTAGFSSESMEKSIISEKEWKPTFEIELCKNESIEYKYFKTTSKLFSINGINGIEDFCGSIKYRTELDVDKENGIIIDLGNVGETAELYVNGCCAGTRIFPPYSFDITKFTHIGTNRIEVIVTNTLGYARPKNDILSRYMLLPPTGILGPMQLKEYKKNHN